MLDELARFGDAVEVATGVEFICALPAEFDCPSGIGHQLIFGQVPA
jgi:hypothetical protein